MVAKKAERRTRCCLEGSSNGTQDPVVWQEGSGDLKYCVHDWLSFSTYNL